MHTLMERRYAALIYLKRLVVDWYFNEEPHHQEWARNEKEEAFEVARYFNKGYFNIHKRTNEEIADLFREAVLELLEKGTTELIREA
jgi:hypothetical protein